MSHYSPQMERDAFAERTAILEGKGTTETVKGKHYKGGIEPIDYIKANDLDFFEGNVIKYITRWKKKDGLNDLRKAQDYIEMLINQQL